MSEQAPQDTPQDRERTKSPRRSMCAAVLSLEAITLGLTTPVMITLGGVDTGVALGVGLGLAAACLLVAGMLRAEWAYGLGWALQVAAVGLGLVTPVMWALGPIFAALWAAAYLLGRRIERERAAAFAEFDRRRASDPSHPAG
ncbi:DUF4233 domain-containing protein [Nocardioides sp. YIM 152588]|uniref:DUF4233 domain-containing protein n=1 Tax=Nocardioides sp. YIM 152588 TaxID=3158259 RepID=UPI0032E443E8